MIHSVILVFVSVYCSLVRFFFEFRFFVALFSLHTFLFLFFILSRQGYGRREMLKEGGWLLK